MNLFVQTPYYLALLLFAFGYAAAYFMYRHTVPQVSAAKKSVLVMLRGTALALILLALCEPLLQFVSHESKKPAIALLADNSLSMTQKDGSGDRAKVLSSLLKSDDLKRLSGTADLKIYTFAQSIEEFSGDSLKVNGGGTNISSALQYSLKSIDDLRGIILLSDGNYNAGANPLYDAEKSRIPVFTVGIGDTNDQKDISVAKLLTNSIGYVDAAIPVEASVRSSGFSPRSVTVSLLEDGKKIDEQSVKLTSVEGVSDIPVKFSYLPKTDGVKKLTVAVAGIDGEITAKNNSRSSLVKILKNKMNIAVIAGAVNADVAAVMQTLNTDKNIEAFLFYQLPNGEFKAQKENSELRAELTKSDALIMIGFPTAQSSSISMQYVEQTVTNRSLPVLFIAGRTLDLQKVRSMEKLFPFSVASERVDEQLVLPSIQERFKYHQLIQADGLSWEKMPPVYYSLPSFTAKPEAQNLLSVKIQNVPLTNPLFLIRSIGSNKSAAILCYGLNRWKTLAGTADETKEHFTLWFSSLVRWLATREQEKLLRVEPAKEFYSQGEQIDLSGQVYNESYQPLDNAEVLVSVRRHGSSDKIETILSSSGTGLYEGNIAGLSEGEYSYSASAVANGDTIGKTSGRISVGEQSVEFAETKMNKPLMKQIASSSGGEYADAASFNALAEKILARKEMSLQEQMHTREYQLWNLPSFL
ncbi:MAG: hypothetical protein ACOYNS_15295, partial [Bacteroidota bacterium]